MVRAAVDRHTATSPATTDDVEPDVHVRYGKDRFEAWFLPPAAPLPYPFRARLADRYHGWCDGRKGIPKAEVQTPSSEDADGAERAQPSSTRVRVSTPRLEYLNREAGSRISHEWLLHHREAFLISQWWRQALASQAAAAEVLKIAQERCAAAARPPSETELSMRRSAEGSKAKRPDDLVRSRRHREHEGRLDAAQQRYLEALEAFKAAELQATVLGDLVTRRTLVTFLRSRQIHEHTGRRIAVYWQRLIRVHRAGALVNGRLEPLVPTLPSWARDSGVAADAGGMP